MKVLIRIAIVVLLANASWRLFTAYTAHYRFRDAVEQVSQFGEKLSDAQLQQKVIDLAGQFDVPVTADNFTIRHELNHTLIDGTYKRPVELLPTIPYDWAFAWHVDTLSVVGRSGPEIANPAPILPR
jgi:hypothetical protein